MIATRSPRPTPEAIRPLATARTSARNSAFVTSTQVPDERLQNATARGRPVPLRAGRSSLKERGRVKAVVTSGLGVFDRGAHVEIGVGVKARAEPDRVAAGGP